MKFEYRNKKTTMVSDFKEQKVAMKEIVTGNAHEFSSK